jgi:phosphate transport system substrate-binding protein
VAPFGCGGQQSGTRENVRAVGSSTVLPFAKAGVGAARPVQSRHSGADHRIDRHRRGHEAVLRGVGASHPDIENASRRMKRSEYDDCAKNGVKDIAEIQVGLDGIAFAERKAGSTSISPADIYKALAKTPFGQPQTAKTWRDVNPSLPAVPILVYGPPSTSGTRDALKELILAKGCESDAAMKALKDSDKARYDANCTEVREDGAYVDSARTTISSSRNSKRTRRPSACSASPIWKPTPTS